MSSRTSGRGEQLVSGGWRLAAGPQWLARLVAGGVSRILDRIDAGLETGSIRTTLPDGSQRLLGGRAPGFDAVVRLNSYRSLVRLATGGSIGWFQAWQEGEWDSPDPVPLFALFMANASALGNVGRAQGPWRWAMRLLHHLRRNTRAGSLRNIHAHYDLGNDFYAAWLDPTMCYSSARFAPGDDLEQAQRRKLESIAARLEGARDVLEIGCGWGALAAHLAEEGARVTAISLSDEQLAFACQRYPDDGIDFRKQDYRDTQGSFDGIVSVEMVEAVGRAILAGILRLHRAQPAAGRSRRDPVYRHARRSVRSLRPKRRFHPGLYLSRRLAGERDASSAGWPASGDWTGGTGKASASTMPRPCAFGANASTAPLQKAGCPQALIALRRSVALLPDVLRRRLSRRRHRCRAGYAGQARLNRFTRAADRCRRCTSG
jgi:SAM-dependent methyltransferase